MLTGEVPFTAETVVGVAMKHVNEPMPDVQKKRPEVSSALAAVVERATREGARRRATPTWPSCLADLEAALEVEVARAGGAHGEATTVLDSVPTKRRKILTTRRVSAAGVFIVLAATAAALLIAALTGKKESPAPAPAPTGAPIEITGTQSFDPSPATVRRTTTSSSSRSTEIPAPAGRRRPTRRRPRKPPSASRASA